VRLDVSGGTKKVDEVGSGEVGGVWISMRLK
jgi:hypothetical protein